MTQPWSIWRCSESCACCQFREAMTTEEQRQRTIDECIARLMEFGEAVQILLTWREPSTGNTFNIYDGRGNWYARTGMAHDFLQQDKARTNAHEMPKPLPPEDDDGEAWKGA